MVIIRVIIAVSCAGKTSVDVAVNIRNFTLPPKYAYFDVCTHVTVIYALLSSASHNYLYIRTRKLGKKYVCTPETATPLRVGSCGRRKI